MNVSSSSTASDYNFLLRNYYSFNRSAAKPVMRPNIRKSALVAADSDALKRISKALRDLEYTSDNGVDIYNNVKAFVDAYNNLSESSKNSTSYDVSHPEKLLQNLVKKHSDELEDLGITIGASGKLSIDKEELLKCSPAKIGRLFSSDEDFTNKIKFYAGKIYKASNYIDLTTQENISSSGKKSVIDLLA